MFRIAPWYQNPQVDEQILIVPPWSGGNLNGAAKIVIEILNDVLLISWHCHLTCHLKVI